MSDAARHVRADYHLTLGQAIDTLRKLPNDTLVQFDWNELSPSSPDSYRGYYADLAFTWTENSVTVGAFLAECQRALGHTYEGYKGGAYYMDLNTPLWASPYGTTIGARAIMAITQANGIVVLTTRDVA